MYSANPVRYANGAAILNQTDLSSPRGGWFAHTRSYGTQTASDYDGPSGYNWFINQMPYLVASGGAVAVVFDPNNPFWFDQADISYTPQFNMREVMLTENTTAQTMTFTQSARGRTEVAIFNSLSAGTAPGGLISYQDADGLISTVTSRTGSQINELQRSYVIGGITTTESMLYQYFGSGTSAAGKLQTVTYRRRTDSGSWSSANNIKQVSYAYYGAAEGFGNLHDLKTATEQLPDGSGGWNDVAVHYYRYYKTGNFVHGLKMHFGPEAYRLMFNAGVNLSTISDTDIQPYADHYYEYDTSRRVTKEIAAVCESCVGGGTTSDVYEYQPNFSAPTGDIYNVWVMRTTQYLPDNPADPKGGSKIIVYTNRAGLTMLYVYQDMSGNQWCTMYRYSDGGQVILQAYPSAISGYNENSADLMGFSTITNRYSNIYMSDTVGLIETADYLSGGLAGYVNNRYVQQGQTGTPVKLITYDYVNSAGSSNNPLAITVYPNGSAVTTSYGYTYDGPGTQMLQRVTTLPRVISTQNGSGSTAVTTTENFDTYGNLTSYIDELGMRTDYTYDLVLGVVTRQTVNVVSGGTDPGMNLVTDYTYDNLGRLIQTLGPIHTAVGGGSAISVRAATWMAYVQSIDPGTGTWGVDQTFSGSGYASGSGYSTYTLVNPVTILKTDKDGRSTDVITAIRSSTTGPILPSETFTDQTKWTSWSSTQYAAQTHPAATPPTAAHQVLSQRTYFLIPSPGAGTLGVNYSETGYGYDILQRRNRVKVSGGTATGSSTVWTITRSVWIAPQRLESVWVGTDDTGAIDSDPTGGGAAGNNMRKVSFNAYGGLTGQDGYVAAVTRYPDGTGLNDRTTSFSYDYRGRRLSAAGGGATDNYTLKYTYDDLNRVTRVERYHTPSNTDILNGRIDIYYDDRSRVYRREISAVDSGGNLTGIKLTSNIWYDERGSVLQQIGAGAGAVFTKTAYNKNGWPLHQYVGYNHTGGMSWTQAGTVANDIILSQTDTTYDNVGNVIVTKNCERLNSESETMPDALSYGTSPKARVSYAATWYDGIGRPFASGNYGARSTDSFSPDATPPASGTTVLVSLKTYDPNSGRMTSTTDPAGIVNQTTFDAAGRTTQTIEDFATSGHLNRTTNYTYTLDNLVSTLQAVNPNPPGTGDQTTTYAYGTTLNTSGVARNDLLASVTYPDTGQVIYTYNRLGQVATIKDQRLNVRTLSYDTLGRLTDDGVTTITTGTDNSILRISATYEVRGMLQTLTSYDNATPGSGTGKNQVQLAYNEFGQLITEWQDHAGLKGSSTPNVQYGYDTGASSSNEVRFNALTFPNGRVITYSYGTAGGINDLLSRVQEIKDGSTSLAVYAYLGLGTVVQIDNAEPHLRLDLWGQTPGTFGGFDNFGRVIDQLWQNNTNTTPAAIDEYKYGYDLNSNRQYKANAMTTGLDEFYTYDNLNRLLTMQRGTLTGTPPSAIGGTIAREMDYTLDATGNWQEYVTKTTGIMDLDQTRVSNTTNEITGITTTTGTAWAVPGYDAAGNTTSFPKPSDLVNSYTTVYDAWNRMVQVKDGTTAVGTYQYDGRNRRIVKTTASETRHFYYTNGWQDVEQRVGSLTTMDQQHVWGIWYVDELVCRDRTVSGSNERVYACQDANFNITALISKAGAVLQRFLYDPYGVAAALNPSTWAITSDAYTWTCRFAGRHYDSETELCSHRARYIHPVLGRFVSRDPSGYSDGASLYEYARSDPSRWTDPFGLQATGPASGPATTQASPPTLTFVLAFDTSFKGSRKETAEQYASLMEFFISKCLKQKFIDKTIDVKCKIDPKDRPAPDKQYELRNDLRYKGDKDTAKLFDDITKDTGYKDGQAIVVITTETQIHYGGPAGPTNAVGYRMPASQDILINSARSFPSLIAHEIGHAAGYVGDAPDTIHSKDEDNIMYPTQKVHVQRIVLDEQWCKKVFALAERQSQGG